MNIHSLQNYDFANPSQIAFIEYIFEVHEYGLNDSQCVECFTKNLTDWEILIKEFFCPYRPMSSGKRNCEKKNSLFITNYKQDIAQILLNKQIIVKQAV